MPRRARGQLSNGPSLAYAEAEEIETMTALLLSDAWGHDPLSTAWGHEAWLNAWREAAPGRPLLTHGLDDYDPAAIRYALTWKPPRGVLKTLPNLEVAFNLGAGVDGVVVDPEFPDVPLVRLVEDDLTNRMGEWVVLQVLHHFRQSSTYMEFQREKKWHELSQPAASSARVGLMGYGTLAQHCAPILLSLGFNVHGWSRSQKPTDVTLHYGEEGLANFLARTDILVCLLPLTDATRGILNADLIGKLSQASPVGPILINAGRGGLQNEADILAALQSGALKGASLDVFNEEPLPADDPLWDAPNLVITPHVAAASDPVATVRYVVRQIEAYEGGAPLKNVVDLSRGY